MPLSSDSSFSVVVGARRRDGVLPVLSFASHSVHARVLHASQLGMGHKGIAWVVDVKDAPAIARLIDLVNRTGGYSFWKFRNATVREVKEHIYGDSE